MITIKPALSAPRSASPCGPEVCPAQSLQHMDGSSPSIVLSSTYLILCNPLIPVPSDPSELQLHTSLCAERKKKKKKERKYHYQNIHQSATTL